MVELLHLDFDDATAMLEELRDLRTIVELSDVCVLIAPLTADAIMVKLAHDCIQLSPAAFLVKGADIQRELLSECTVKVQDILDIEFSDQNDARKFRTLLRKRRKTGKLNRKGRLLV